MGIKTIGLTMAAFYNDQNFWGERFHDDVLFIIDGARTEEMISEKLNPQSIVEIECGYVVDEDGNAEDLSEFFSRWEKSQTQVSLLVTVDKDKEHVVRNAILAVGGVIT
jgi:hypothetical protein